VYHIFCTESRNLDEQYHSTDSSCSPSAAELKGVSLFGILAFLELAGMFSEQTIEWLRQIFDQMFRKLTNVETQGGLKTRLVARRRSKMLGELRTLVKVDSPLWVEATDILGHTRTYITTAVRMRVCLL
jgi:hypothetical protein